jgi:hypothetical protein
MNAHADPNGKRSSDGMTPLLLAKKVAIIPCLFFASSVLQADVRARSHCRQLCRLLHQRRWRWHFAG